MADTAGQADIRGINIDRLAKGFADEAIIFKQLCTVAPTSAREVRWYQKTAGFLDSTDTTGITASQIAGVPHGAQPVVVGQTWTRNTSYVKKFFVESEWMSEEDIKDNDVDILGTTVRDLVRAVGHQVDLEIWNTITENQSAVNINTTTTTSVGGDQWDAASYAGDPIADIADAMRQIRDNSYDPMGGSLLLSPKDYQSLLAWLISGKGSSIPSFASQKVQSGVVMELLGLRVRVNTQVTADYAAVVVDKRACTWKSFMGISSTVITDPGIGRKIRVWETGVALLTDPKAVTLIIDTQT